MWYEGGSSGRGLWLSSLIQIKTMDVILAVLAFIDIVALTFVNGYWVREAPCCRAIERGCMAGCSCSDAAAVVW